MPRKSIVAPALIALALVCAFAFQSTSAPAPVDRVADPFATGWMVTDTNGDGIADFIAGKIVVPAQASAAENAAAANLAARVGFASTGMTPPVVVAGDSGSGPRIRVGRAATPPVVLEKEEGGVFFDGGVLALVSADDAGLQAAAEAYSARAPYQWRVPGEKLAAIADAVREAAPGAPVELVGVTYLKGKAGVHRAFLRSGGTIAAAALEKALASAHLAVVHSLAILGGATAVNAKAEPAIPPQAAGDAGAPAPAAGGAAAAPTRLDLATLYTSRGLFGAAGRIPLPASLNGHLYVPAGAAGTAMANLAARMGMESTGINLPLATPVDGATPRDVRATAVLAGSAALSQEAERKLRAQDTAAAQSETPLAAGEGELRIVDNAFGRRAAVLTGGDEAGQAAALGLLADRFPNLWEQGKQHLSLEEIRYDLHRFFSQRSSAGQAAAGLYQLDRWMRAIGEGARDVSAELYVDVADPGLADFARKQWKGATVKTGSLHAGTQCCDKDPLLHYRAPNVPFHQAAPTFTEDVVVPWEGRRLTDAVRRAAAKITPGQDVNLVARVSEGPEERRKLTAEIKDILAKAGADARRLNVEVLCAYKPGYSWLMDEIAPALAGKNAASIRIDFAKNVDPTGVRSMHSEARWVQELYPVDEMLARKLNLPLEKITLNEIEPPADGATYRVHAWDAAGKEILTREFTVTTHMQPYNGVIPRYEQVQVDTGWVQTGSRRQGDSERTHPHRPGGILGPLPEPDAAQGVPVRHVAGSRRAACGVFSALRHHQAGRAHERAGLQPGSGQGAHLFAGSRAGRHLLLHRNLPEHDG